MSENRTSAVVEENLKKALVEMLMLALLHERAYYAPELNQALAERSGGAVNVSFPYAALYRMIEQGYIQEMPKRKAPDGRRIMVAWMQNWDTVGGRPITDTGRQFFKESWSVYKAFIAGVDLLVDSVCPEMEKENQS